MKLDVYFNRIRTASIYSRIPSREMMNRIVLQMYGSVQICIGYCLGHLCVLPQDIPVKQILKDIGESMYMLILLFFCHISLTLYVRVKLKL